MKKMIFLASLIVFLSATVFAQEKIEAPVWNVGDKWAFDQGGPMEVVKCDGHCYLVMFSGKTFPQAASGVAVIERSTLNITHVMDGNNSKKYSDIRKKILNFPLTIGKEWKDLYQRNEPGIDGIAFVEYIETFRVLGWEEVAVRAGKFKAVKVEYRLEPYEWSSLGCFSRPESKAVDWYSPEAKNLVKCRYEKGYSEGSREAAARKDWELVSYELKK
jgi:hypothetical protein